MAYVKSEKVLAEIEGRKALIVAAAIDIIKRDGIEATTSAVISEASGLSVGLIYKHFPDIEELRAHVLALLLARDLELLRAAGSLPEGIRAWAKHMARDARMTAACAANAVYREGVKRELAKLIKATGADSPAILAAVVAGAVFEAAGTLRPRDEVTLTAALLRAIGVRVRA